MLSTLVLTDGVGAAATPGGTDAPLNRSARPSPQIRQELLGREPPFQLSVVMDESVPLRKIGDRGLMHAQLLRLAAAAELPNVELRVMPLSGRECSLVTDSFTILSLGPQPTDAAGQLADVVSTEGVTGELYVEGESGTYLYRLVFQGLVKVRNGEFDRRR
jgi:hypothetical protein